MTSVNSKTTKAIHAINRNGILLLYPINNQKEPRSLWSELYPRSKMVWDWNEDSDNRVAELWYLREELSRSNKVVYSKWYKGRATFFSCEVFKALYRLHHDSDQSLPKDSKEILEALRMDSPLSTRQLKEITNLKGKLLERSFEKAMKVLWQRMDIVGYGEVEDSAFPSLAVGAANTIFEDLVNDALKMNVSQAEKIVFGATKNSEAMAKYLRKSLHTNPNPLSLTNG